MNSVAVVSVYVYVSTMLSWLQLHRSIHVLKSDCRASALFLLVKIVLFEVFSVSLGMLEMFCCGKDVSGIVTEKALTLYFTLGSVNMVMPPILPVHELGNLLLFVSLPHFLTLLFCTSHC